MKKIAFTALLSMLLLVLGPGTKAQTGIKFGLKGGYSMATQYGTPAPDDTYEVSTSVRPGFYGGVFVYFPITESVGLQQEWMYAMKGSGQDVSITVPVPINTVSDYKINYLEMPMVVKYRFVNIGTVSIYGNTGIALSMLLGGDYSVVTTIEAGGPPIIEELEGDMKTLDTFDYSFVYGYGVDFNLLGKTFFFEGRMTVGWNVLNMPNSTGADPVPLRNQDYILSLGMYF